MPLSNNGTYTPPDGALNAFPGKIIASATWNAIFQDITNVLTLLAQVNVREPYIVTTAGPFTVTTETYFALNKAAPSVTAIALPAVASRSEQALTIVDWAGNAGDITITPNGAETIEGLASWILASSGGAGFGGRIILRPSVDLNGWAVL